MDAAQVAMISVTPSSRESNNRRDCNHGHDNAIGVTHDNMTAISDVHPNLRVNRAGSSRDDMMANHCPVHDRRLTRWRTVSFTIRCGLRVDVPVEQINALDVTDLRANVLTSNWPLNWCEHKMLTMISTLDGELPVGKPIISAVVFTERPQGGFGGQIILRMGNASLARAVIRVFNGRMTLDSLLPLRAVQMHTAVPLIQDRDYPGLIPGQVRINEQVWGLADVNRVPDPYRSHNRAREEDHVDA